MSSSILRSYDDVWPITIRQTESKHIIMGTPFIIASDEKTLVNQLKSQLKVSEKYAVISASKTFQTVAILAQNRASVILSEVIHLPSRRWKKAGKDERDFFVLSMILRAYFEREDTFNWSREKVIEWFKGIYE